MDYMDYKELLKKYINHVGDQEGIDFTDRDKPDWFTDEEWKELIDVAKEAYNEHYKI